MAIVNLRSQNVTPLSTDNNLHTNSSQEEMAKQVQQAVILAESTVESLKKQEKAFDRTQNLVYVGFIVLTVMVAGMLLTYIQMLIQANNETNKNSIDSLSKINEKIDVLSNRVDTIDNRARQTTPTTTSSTQAP